MRPVVPEAPALEMISKDIAIFGIAYKDRSEDTAEFLRQFGNPFQAVGMDIDGRTGIRWGVYGVPETYLLDAEWDSRAQACWPFDTRHHREHDHASIEGTRIMMCRAFGAMPWLFHRIVRLIKVYPSFMPTKPLPACSWF